MTRYQKLTEKAERLHGAAVKAGNVGFVRLWLEKYHELIRQRGEFTIEQAGSYED